MTDSHTSRPRFASYEREVEDMVDRHMPFGQIEDAIDATELSSDQKAALWIVAWSLDDTEPRPQRRREPSLVG
jgi:hypothetical protein